MCNTQIKRPQHQFLRIGRAVIVAKIMPEAQRHARQLQPAAPAAVIGHFVSIFWSQVYAAMAGKCKAMFMPRQSGSETQPVNTFSVR